MLLKLKPIIFKEDKGKSQCKIQQIDNFKPSEENWDPFKAKYHAGSEYHYYWRDIFDDKYIWSSHL